MLLTAYFSSLNPAALMRAVPGSIAQGLIWGLLALGVYITYKLLDFADLSVDGTIATGGAVAVMLIKGGVNPWCSLIFAFLAGMLAGLVTGLLHTALGIPPILAGILTQISLYSINLNIMGSSNEAVSVDKYNLVASSRYLTGDASTKFKIFAVCILFCVAVVVVLYWFFGTELGHAIRATGCNGQMARAQGINTNMCKVIALMLSNGIVGLSGGLYAQCGKRFTFAYTLFAVITGAIIYYLVLSIVLWLKLPTNDLKLFSAIVVAIFLAVPYLKEKAKTSRRA
jgi:putative ABC transport system permease protein